VAVVEVAAVREVARAVEAVLAADAVPQPVLPRLRLRDWRRGSIRTRWDFRPALLALQLQQLLLQRLQLLLGAAVVAERVAGLRFAPALRLL